MPLHLTKSTCRDVYDYFFESPEVRTLLYRMCVEWGFPLEQMGLGLNAIGVFGIYLN